MFGSTSSSAGNGVVPNNAEAFYAMSAQRTLNQVRYILQEKICPLEQLKRVTAVVLEEVKRNEKVPAETASTDLPKSLSELIVDEAQKKTKLLNEQHPQPTNPGRMVLNNANEGRHLNKLIALVDAQMSAARSQTEKDDIFAELKNTPYLLASYLKHCRIRKNKEKFDAIAESVKSTDKTELTEGQTSSSVELSPDEHNLQRLLLEVENRLKATTTQKEREDLFNDLRKTPYLFCAFLKMSPNTAMDKPTL